MSKSKNLMKYFLKELEEFIAKLESHKASLHDKSHGSTDSSDSAGATKVEPMANIPEPTAETAAAFKDAPVKAPGVQPPPIGDVSPLTVDGVPATLNEPKTEAPKTEEESPMLIKSTDGVGPDIQTSDVPNPGLTAEQPDGKPVDQSYAVDSNKINLPTPIGALGALSVNGPVQDGSEQKPEGDSEPMEADPIATETAHQDLKAEDVPSAEPLPVDENATPKADTKVTSTFDPIELKADSPVYSPRQPEAEGISLPELDKVKTEPSEEEPVDYAVADDSADPTGSDKSEQDAEIDPEEDQPDDSEELKKP